MSTDLWIIAPTAPAASLVRSARSFVTPITTRVTAGRLPHMAAETAAEHACRTISDNAAQLRQARCRCSAEGPSQQPCASRGGTPSAGAPPCA